MLGHQKNGLKNGDDICHRFFIFTQLLTYYNTIMSKEKRIPGTQIKPKGNGGEKIDVKVAAAALKLYWEDLVGKNKITSANCPQSISFDLHKLKAYLNEVEAEFARMNVPYDKRRVSVMPIAYSEKDTFSVLFTPSVTNADNLHQHQFNTPIISTRTKSALAKVAATGSSNYDFQLSPLNSGNENP